MQARERPSVGFVELEERFRDLDIRRVIEEASEDNMEFICYYIGGEERATLDISPEGLIEEEEEEDIPIPSISVVDLQMTAAHWSKRVVGRVSPWIDVDSEDSRISEMSEKCLVEELNYMKYLGLSAMMLELPRGRECANLARVLQDFLWGPSAGNFKIWVVVPLHSSHTSNNGRHNSDGDNKESQQGEEDNSWSRWYGLRTMCGNSQRLGVCLQLTAEMPEDPRVMERWLGEPLACIWLDTSLFMTNQGGWPVLSSVHQDAVKGALAQGTQAILGGKPGHGSSLKAYMDYLDKMWKERTMDTALLAQTAGYHDFLQVPLQPLSDNLEASVYEVFETDPVKYKAYGEAIFKAMRDLVLGGEMVGHPRIPPSKSHLVVMILGAGRGPLVRQAIAAYRLVRKNVNDNARAKFYVVEKNDNAVHTLRFRKG